MDETKLNEMAELILDTLREGKDFISEQAPLVIQEFIAWSTAAHIFGVAAFSIVVFALAFVAWKFFKYGLRDDIDNSDSEAALVVGFITSAVSAILAPGIFINLYNLTQVLVAPRVYLLEWAMQHMK